MSESNELIILDLEQFGLLSVEDAAARRNVSTETIRTWFKKGLPVVPASRSERNQKFFVPIKQLDAYTPQPKGRPKEGEEAKPEPKKNRGRKPRNSKQK